jgi:hypothetical protein
LGPVTRKSICRSNFGAGTCADDGCIAGRVAGTPTAVIERSDPASKCNFIIGSV